jgi:hypothetical protein
MTRAVWGRMKTGRCVEIHPSFLESHGKDPMFLGCHADVLPVADRKCSGKPECDIKIPDPEFDNIKPCYTGLTMYFEASYRCVRGIYIVIFRLCTHFSAVKHCFCDLCTIQSCRYQLRKLTRLASI